VAGISTVLALLGLGTAHRLYRNAQAGRPDPLALRLGRLFAFFSRAWGLDDLYETRIVRPFKHLTAALAAADLSITAGMEAQPVRLILRAAAGLRILQTGQLNWNVAGIVGGLIVLLLVLGWMR
jgi:hypothetical protein